MRHWLNHSQLIGFIFLGMNYNVLTELCFSGISEKDIFSIRLQTDSQYDTIEVECWFCRCKFVKIFLL